MKLNYGAFLFVLMLMSALATYAQKVRGDMVVGGAETASTTSALPDAVFIDWHQADGKNIFELSMPWGKNGSFAELLENDNVVASTTLPEHTPFAQRANFTIDTPQDGMYQYVARLCLGVATSAPCTESTPLAFVVRGGALIEESTLLPDELTLDRIQELHDMRLARAAEWAARAERRLIGLIAPSIGVQEGGPATNIDPIARVRRIVMGDTRHVLFAPTNSISRSDLFAAIAKFPAFCNESVDGETLDVACKRELAALTAYITYFTSKGDATVSSGMRNPPGAVFLLGNDAGRFEKLFPAQGGISYDTLADRIEAHPEDALLAVLWWYMTPQSPEPDPHSALLGIWVPNREDRARGIAPGFGATVNIVTHGASCREGASYREGYTLRTLYQNYLQALGGQDVNSDLCITQAPFGIGGSAFLPQYWKYDEFTDQCTRGVVENAYFVQDNGSYARCMSLRKATSTVSMWNDDFSESIKDIDDLSTRVGTSSGLAASGVAESDPRTGLGALIIGTYADQRAQMPQTQPMSIPYAKINALFYEGAFPGIDGALQLRDARSFHDEYFAGDCFREECARGLAHQFALAKKRYPQLAIVLSIGGWDGSQNFSSFRDVHKRELFVESIHRFLLDNPTFGGIDITWMYPRQDPGGDPSDPNGDRETLRHLVVELRAMLNGMYENDSVLRTLYLGIGASADEVAAVGLPAFASLLDGVHLITYDLHGPWEQVTGHGAQLFATNIGGDTLSVANAVTAVRKYGVPAKKIIIGIPYYGRIWDDVPKGDNALLPGLGVSIRGTTSASLIDYRTIASMILGKGEYQYYEDALRGAAYLYDGKHFVSYDTPEIIEQKMQYVWKDGFGGVLLADIMGDDGTLQDRVLSVIAKQSEQKSCKLARLPERNLSSNSRGADVFALQQFLVCLGYIPTYVDINGNYTAATVAGVTLFQKAEGLETTGVVGKEMRERLLTYK